MADDPPAGGPGGADEEREDREEPRDSSDSEPADQEREDASEGEKEPADGEKDQASEGDGQEPGGDEEAAGEETAPDEESQSGGYVDLPEAPANSDADEEAAPDDAADDTNADQEEEAAEDADKGAADTPKGAEPEQDHEPDEDEDGAAEPGAPDTEPEEDGDEEPGEDADEHVEESAGEADEDIADGDDEADEDIADGDDEADEDIADGDDEASSQSTVEMHDDTTPIQRKTGPASDKEQPLADHIEEMVKRLAIVVVVAGVVSLLAFPFGEDFILFLWYSVLPADISQPHVYHPLELVITQLKAASLLGLVLALPVFVYETYAFMRPGLYPHERRYYLAAVPTSLILAFVGLLFGYFIVLPAVMNYFLYYSDTVVDIAFALGQTFSLMLILLGYLAIVFQIPLFVMLAIMMGLTTRVWLEERRLIFWGAFLGISFLFSPDPTGMAPIVIAATMVALFEGTLLLLRWTGRG